eukprot:CAMPEP_0206499390 /NCGR_PEP_ID=MMETSP0324_2-20121206/51687_1 /ASSEMBLY_ACC=CAM_ASM_000836 /TAXON_ID=2866 /ORGANISM="Crypthecodinium cohnii, Strain Seligo" /LENGTH=38 /DNA_ID=CAMNT_0053986011 /DNA_START=274 /DNA_END=390 /DNA_ORIENTATION=+
MYLTVPMVPVIGWPLRKRMAMPKSTNWSLGVSEASLMT